PHPGLDPQTRFDARIRALEAAFPPPAGRAPDAAPGAARAPLRMPQPGDERDFKVLDRDNRFETVRARVRRVSAAAVWWEDVRAEGAYSDTAVELLANEFDELIFPTDTATFGAVSDLDGNGLIDVLFTPVVNELTPRGSAGFVAGFFFGLDLRPELENSNRGEIFYAMVPDGNGRWGDVRLPGQVLDELPAIMAHELQHMIHFNQRVLVGGAERTEALWLSEGLAQMAEDIVGDAAVFRAGTGGFMFDRGNLRRAARYLAAPWETSLLYVTGGGTLEERGGGWLFMRHLRDRLGGDNALLRRLTASTRTGIDNLVAEAGIPWPQMIADFGTALAGEGFSVVRSRSRPALHFERLDLLIEFQRFGLENALPVDDLADADFVRSGTLWSAGVRHYSGNVGGLALSLSGEGGLPPPPESGLQMQIVRVF
ncbi:MAG: hypothetical protein D6701_04625, partial [Gemmatimonadetes bacterium]